VHLYVCWSVDLTLQQFLNLRNCYTQLIMLLPLCASVYMAPEVFQREYGTAADMWSLGMMLYQFMTCRFPFWCISFLLAGPFICAAVFGSSEPTKAFSEHVVCAINAASAADRCWSGNVHDAKAWR